MKRQGRKIRWWKIAALFCAAVLLFTGIFIARNPEILFNLYQPVPISWMQNAHLVRTEQGAILLQFTPSAQYRHFFGFFSVNGHQRTDAAAIYDTSISYAYPKLARLLNKDISHASYQRQYEQTERALIRHSNGDWLIPMPYGKDMNDWRYHEGGIAYFSTRGLTNEEIVACVQLGISLTSHTEICAIEEKFYADYLWLADAGGKRLLYQKGEEIPLCDEETQKQFDQLILQFPWLYLEESELIETKD